VRTLYERDVTSIAGIEKLRFFPLEVVSGHGSTLVTPDGRELLDLSATWTACGLGHGHPAVAEAVSRAVRTAPGAGGLSAVHPDSVGLAGRESVSFHGLGSSFSEMVGAVASPSRGPSVAG